MYKNLEDYLKEIRRYLVTNDNKDEILMKIKGHILENTQEIYGNITEENINHIIKSFGEPHEAATNYCDVKEIIKPSFFNYLFLYTFIFFAIHLSLCVFSVFFVRDIWIIPFVYIPHLNAFQLIYYLPTILIFDFGLAAAILVIKTRFFENLKLPWIYDYINLDSDTKNKSTVLGLLVRIISVLMFAFIYKVFGLPFASITNAGLVPLFQDDSTQFIFYFILGLLTLETLAYGIKFFFNSEIIDIFKTLFTLTILFVFMGSITPNIFASNSIFELNDLFYLFFKAILVIVVIVNIFDLIKNIIKFGLKSLGKYYYN